MPDQIRHDLREARRASAMTWARFTLEAGFHQAYLRSVENGNRSVTLGVATAYDRVLRTGGVFTRRLEATGSATAGNTPWNRAGALTVLARLSDGSDVDRRSFLTVGVALSASARGWSEAVERLRTTRTRAPLPGGPAVLAHVNERLDHLMHLDDELGSGEVYRLARGELSLIVGLIKSGRYDGPTVDRLHSTASEAARQVAWAAFDQGRLGIAQRYFDASLRASAEARDPIGGAYALSFAAIQCYSAPGQAQRAISLLETAHEQVKHKATPRMHAMLAARTARALSKTGAKKECARQLDVARAALDRGRHDDDPRTLYWVDYGEVEMIAGSAALQLGEPARAIRYFEAAMQASYPGDDEYPRSHAIYLARAAEAHLALHDLDAAVATARHAARCLGSVDSARSATELTGLRAKLAAHLSHAGVRDFLQVG
ncbi:helix-turn-helix transcriptional regulator (plasmid) [Embleya sp. NBC_00888]|uniref:helix-turn-helix domain-containing protein n=1 Tax=Embleya sp. NBC_00888 TaxID=2975960 RepID=UPI002F9174F9|nr:helix-turn-helix transcriptional regulator [Embleya sp. NBC_00888]